jgi:DNA-binding SARP family transcriptional activator/tetratricopeptide (TPR) repeat protein
VAVAWDRPPVAPESNLRTYIARIRRALGPTDGTRLITGAGGYRLTVRPGELDLDTFLHAVRQGERAEVGGELSAAAEHLGRAARLWRGRPLAGQALSPVLQAEVTRLEEIRLGAAERYARVRVELGEHDAAAADLRALLVDHPFREELWAQLMFALHRGGRRAEALAAFAGARHILVAELGIEPGPKLRQMHREVLAEPIIESTVADGFAEPRQLPMDIAEFTGRQAELGRLHAIASNSCAGTAVPVCVIQGMAGIGKTRLAIHAAHELIGSGRFDQVQLWTDLRGFDPRHPPADPAAVLERFLHALGVPSSRIPSDIDARAALYRDRLSGKRALVLLDNAAGEDQIHPLLPGSPGCFALITSRRHLSKLDGAHLLSLDLLSRQEATSLLASICDDGRIAAEPAAVTQLAEELCGRLPIAVVLAARKLRNHPLWTVSDLVQRMTGMRPSAGTDDLTRVFDLSYHALTSAQQRVFRLLALHPGEDLTAELAAALGLITLHEAETLLEGLLDAHLLQQVTTNRYRFHDLIREYARHRVHTDDTAEDRLAALSRMLVWYLHSAEAARLLLDPHRRRVVPLPARESWCFVAELRDYQHALAWCEAERANLVAAVHTSVDSGLFEIAWQLPWVLLSFYYLRSLWGDWIATHQVALRATRAAGERRYEAVIWRGLGVAYSDLRDFRAAIDCHRRAQVIFEAVDDPHGQAWNLNNLGVVHVELNQLTEAADCFGRALPMFRDTADAQGEGICLNNLGDTLWQLGQLAPAFDHLEQALAVQRDSNDLASLRFTLTSLGDLHHHARRYQQAQHCYRQVVATAASLGNQRTVARALTKLATILRETGQTRAAADHLREALTIFDELGDPQADAIRAQLAGLNKRDF